MTNDKRLEAPAVPRIGDGLHEIEQKLKWVRKFIEYARYELQPGVQEVGDQFPRQDAADKAMAEIDHVLAALSRLPVAGGQAWQPIETAPKDGTELLLCEFRYGQFGHIEHGSWGFIERSDWDGMAVYGWMTDCGRIDEPTHWMPALPKPTDPPSLAPGTPAAAQEPEKGTR